MKLFINVFSIIKMLYIYVLKLTNNKYYIGKTVNPVFRLDSHFDSNGSVWTSKYKPVSVIEIIPNCDDYDEDKITKKYMGLHGIKNVRGGSYTKINLEDWQIKSLEHELKGSNDLCYICGKSGHFASDCDDSLCYSDVWCCDYCDKEFDNEEKCSKHENICKNKIKKEFSNLKKEFLLNCKNFDKSNNNIIQGDEIIQALIKTDKTYNFKLTNIYGICQTISKCDELKPICSYRNGINYIDFIDGLIYITKNNTKICEKCDNEMCICKNTNKKTHGLSCYRCGRPGHKSQDCYAKTNIDGDDLSDSEDSDDYEEIEVFCCDYCQKEFETLKGLTCHQNLYCSNKKKSYLKTNTKYTKKDSCYRCGREGHFSDDCYASTHANGKKLK